MTTKYKEIETRQKLSRVIEELSDERNLKTVVFSGSSGMCMPSMTVLKEIINLARSVLFPGYFEEKTLSAYDRKYHIGVAIERLHSLLRDQVLAGMCFAECECEDLGELEKKADEVATTFLERLPEMRETLASDVVASYNGDPAAKSYGEVIFCYPVMKALTNYRVAHELLLLGVPIIPRFISEMAHSETGIDIHPGAKIGKSFTIDHGTGTVIGETAVIGNNVKIYQGVTLGAKSFPLDDNGNPIKGIPRHPHLEDDIIVYSNASILGNITIGRGSIIGGNTWIDYDVPAGSRIFKR